MEYSPGIKAAAEAMRIKRSELQSQPLDRVWREIAYAGVMAFQKASEDERSAEVRRLSVGGAN